MEYGKLKIGEYELATIVCGICVVVLILGFVSWSKGCMAHELEFRKLSAQKQAVTP